MRNAYRDFLALIPQHPLEVGAVPAAGAGHVTVTLPGGGVIHSRWQATLGQRAFIRDGGTAGPAPAPTYVECEAQIT